MPPAAFKTGGDYGRLKNPSPLVASGNHPLAAGASLPREAGDCCSTIRPGTPSWPRWLRGLQIEDHEAGLV